MTTQTLSRSLMGLLLVLAALLVQPTTAEEDAFKGAVTGPVVPDFGPVMLPPPGAYNLDPQTHYKVSIDIGETAEFPGDLNRKLVSVARFLNMNAQYGVPSETLSFLLLCTVWQQMIC